LRGIQEQFSIKQLHYINLKKIYNCWGFSCLWEW